MGGSTRLVLEVKALVRWALVFLERPVERRATTWKDLLSCSYSEYTMDRWISGIVIPKVCQGARVNQRGHQLSITPERSAIQDEIRRALLESFYRISAIVSVTHAHFEGLGHRHRLLNRHSFYRNRVLPSLLNTHSLLLTNPSLSPCVAFCHP